MTELMGCFSAEIKKPEHYCNAIQHLLDEHRPLEEQLKSIYYTASQIAYDPTRKDRHDLLHKLYNDMIIFRTNVQKHSYIEEEVFNSLKKYIGYSSGPIVIMEQEHERVDSNIQQFLEKCHTLSNDNRDDIRDIVHHISNVFHILTDHWLKEEEILFPLGEQLLSAHEKDELERFYLDKKSRERLA
ncbi:hemerythrin domain-containing protein [Evansella sp. AB-rgal1]|uniref:hemerythrin domain-containing protein n=1 Tax=Evansella sp. AB-rgal1 TaxID=3242696 RepID=UPI00359E76C8